MLRGAVGLATLLKLTPAVIGLTVVAAGTSVPELAVSAMASYQGSSEIAVANVIGSNIFNITVILGLCALFRPIAIIGNTIRLEYPVLLLVTFLGVVLEHDGKISRLDGLLFITFYVGFTAYLVRLVRRQVSSEEAAKLKAEVTELTPVAERPRVWICLALLTAGVAFLGIGANVTVNGAVQLARLLGWSERVIGLTIVSAGTGLPEVVASVISSVRGRSDVAVGNVIGSNLFNILGVLGFSSLAAPLPVDPQLVSTDAWWMLGITVLLFPLLWSGRQIIRAEGLLLLGVYCFYISRLLIQ
ncbi:Inner membrane protein YrbG [Bythopirellula polymerisocia]|uniref:Inner membrane protein YrbG n=2 Tax=Bythopirellula polymerisocia TaxID=2528003 RepID=A0A5C6CA40_9BACT|nr:Inner membrane protein YrbG [Bythopirellula polymerisocia]